MSYDVDLLFHAEPCVTCGHVPESPRPDLPSPTYNLTPIFDLALTGEALPNPEVGEGAVVLLRERTDRPRGLRVLDGRKAGDTAAQIERALAQLRDPAREAEFVALEPPNRWGTLLDAISVLENLLAAAREWPAGTWMIR